MGHELVIDANGKASVAAAGGAKSMWHGLGQEILPGDSIEVIQRKAGLDWEVLQAPITYVDKAGHEHTFKGTLANYRSDTSEGLGLVSNNRYHIVQPREVMEFFRDFLADNKLSIETAGAVKGGRVIWCMAKLGPEYDFLMPGKDRVNSYVRLQTSFDKSRATDLVATSVRQVCANTMALVDRHADRDGYKVNHSIKFDAKELQEAFGLLGEQHKVTKQVWDAMVKRKVDQAEAANYFCELLAIDPEEVGQTDKAGKKLVSGRTENVLKQLAANFTQSPGASLKSAKGTAFGLMQAVTYYVDHQMAVQDNYDDGKTTARLTSAWFGAGAKLKDDAQWFAADLAGVSHLVEDLRKEAVEA
jgi:phage/plasmid-like protein (TIGR03299 family)